MDYIYPNTPKTVITHNSKTSGSKVLFEDLSNGYLGFMQITRVSQSCRLGSQVEFLPGPNQAKKLEDRTFVAHY